MSLPTLAKAWSVTGRNPRRRPNYVPLAVFKTLGDEKVTRRMIARWEREAVLGSDAARKRLGWVKLIRQFLNRRDPEGMAAVRLDLVRGFTNKEALVERMRKLKP